MSDCNSYGSSPFPYSPHRKARVALAARNKQKRKDRIMIIAPNQTGPVNSNAQDAKKQKAAPSREAVEKMAYKLWLNQGQQPGCEQKNWFEAEAQLKAA